MARRLFEGLDHAKLYNNFRPGPPIEIISKILNYMGTELPCRHVVDVGCGSGQSTVALAPHFQLVTGFDVSEAQITEAIANRKQDNIEYQVSPAEKLPVASKSVELVTAFASMHWFDHQKFLSEVKRILVPDGVLAVCGKIPSIPISANPEKNRMLGDLYNQVYYDILKPNNTPEVSLARNNFRDVDFPFEDVQRESKISTKFSSTAAHMAGYTQSTSFFQELKKIDPKKAEDLVDFIQQRMKDILEAQEPLDDIPLDYDVQYFVILCRQPGD